MTPFDFSQRTGKLLAKGEESNSATAAAQAAAEQLKDAVASVGWEFIDVGDRLHLSQAPLLVTGIVTWDPSELNALRELAVKGTEARIAVFDLDRMGGQAEVSRVMPGVSQITQSPAVAWYRLGKLHRFSQGKAAYDAIEEFMASCD